MTSQRLNNDSVGGICWSGYGSLFFVLPAGILRPDYRGFYSATLWGRQCVAITVSVFQ